MSRRKKLLLAVLGGLALLLVLLPATAFVALRFVDLAPLRERIVTQLSRQLGAEVKLRRLGVSPLPVPHVVLGDVSLSIPGAFDATFKSASVYVRLLPLVKAKLELATVRFDGLDLRAHLPQRRGGPEAAPVSASATEMKNAAASAVAAFSAVAAAQAPGMLLVVGHGSVTLFAGPERAFSFKDIDARVRFPPNRLSVDLTCASNLWEHMSLSASLDTTTLDGSGRVDVTRLWPQVMSARLLPEGGPQLGESEVNLGARISTDGLNVLDAEVDGAIPSLTVRRGAESVVMKGANLKATLHVDDKTTTLAVTDLRLVYPRLQLSGNLALNHAAALASAELGATDIDVPSVREVATVVAGEAELTREIFDIVRGGEVPHFKLQSNGRSLADLGDAVVIHARLVHGRIHVPGVQLDFDDVVGDATVAQDVLIGEQAAARLGNSRVAAGTLRVGLSGDAPELHVEAMVQSDAAELPAQLKRLIDSPSFSRTLDRIGDVQGTASGKVVLNGNTRDVAATVDVSQFDVSGRFQGIPEALQIQGGRFSYDAGRIALTDVDVALGASMLSQLSVRVDTSQTRPFLEATTGASRIELDKVHPWLAASGWLGRSTSNPKALSGTVALESLRVSGPADTPGDWRVELAGEAKDLEIEWPLRERIAIHYPVSLSDLRLVRDATTGTSFSANVAAPNGLTAFVDLVSNSEELNIKQLQLRDAESDASLALLVKQPQFDLKFKGWLSKRTLDRLLPNNHLLGGWVRGDFRARIVTDKPTRTVVEGKLAATDVLLLEKGSTRLQAASLSLDASGGKVRVDAAIDAGADSRLRVQGSVNPSPQAFNVDLDLTAGHFEWDKLEPLLQLSGTGHDAGTANVGNPPLRGTLRVALESFTYGGFTWKPLRALVALTTSPPAVAVTAANLCGIATPGTIAAIPGGLRLAFKPRAKNQELEPMLACLVNDQRLVTGQYSFTGDITAHGNAAEIGESLQGDVEFNAKSGRIYRLGALAEVFSVVSVVSGSVWNVSQLTKDGLEYTTIRVKGHLKGGTLTLSEAVMDGPSMKIACEGSVDVIGRSMDLTFLVAPLKTVDSLVSHIPVISGIFGGSLVSVPVKVTGSLDDPKVTPLSPSAVGSGLMRVMTRTLKLPFKLIDPLFKGKKKNDGPN